ncbi:MAG: enoyl-CoA hydratase-related protein [Thermofilaceae archaeon]
MSVQIEKEPPVAVIKINRPEALNALSLEIVDQLVKALDELESDENIKAVVLTGTDRAFSVGADIKEMYKLNMAEVYLRGHRRLWDRIRRFKKPIIAAVKGYCLGGGFELAMACDMIIAADDAIFGQPEINVGIIPGEGGTQRIPRTAGRLLAMEYVLTGRFIPAWEAYRRGLVNKLVPKELVVEYAKRVAEEIAEKSPLAVALAKDAVNAAWETTLSSGLDYERRNFIMALFSEDGREGISAFIEKRKPQFKGR